MAGRVSGTDDSFYAEATAVTRGPVWAPYQVVGNINSTVSTCACACGEDYENGCADYLFRRRTYGRTNIRDRRHDISLCYYTEKLAQEQEWICLRVLEKEQWWQGTDDQKGKRAL
ncbi:hypothetical protein CC1G_01101 [Coprinopsis cinerea okayama7|uniref:Uncharacterized protein n=1 Tax=Coprinopsis cinerea (strain Okayama-7 / 130 / ATCC MYA-4618 / FGSC 9003) TaxID=240176 RepID=A8NEI7_COPC7|nr:hypothetical protein CC1G_01101 [Coprinopsis cinerea okayama7\|eukprot:XP_001833039.2 hypothetical protein CC1G_01101 [Coprinopsis cinerea okayama7\